MGLVSISRGDLFSELLRVGPISLLQASLLMVLPNQPGADYRTELSVLLRILEP